MSDSNSSSSTNSAPAADSAAHTAANANAVGPLAAATETLRKTGLHTWGELVIGLFVLFFAYNWFLWRGYSVTLWAVAAFGFTWWQLRLQGSLGERLESFKAQNDRLKGENDKLEGSVGELRQQNVQLKGTSDALAREAAVLQGNVGQLREGVDALDETRKRLEEYAAKTGQDLSRVIGQLKDTLSQQQQVVEQQADLVAQHRRAQEQQDRVLLHQLQAQVQFLDQKVGLSQQEFDVFVSMLPQRYGPLLAGRSFGSFDADKDGCISPTEFQLLVDDLCREAQRREATASSNGTHA
eukprot:TRINITY_DN20355_c0_g1_i1.p2 TRINITY_DN20355_c0_g1~~TRINITY_DN20355_c0_g1_i1.p2  ORF type:complete len:296 (-),score=87.88 TRINITY_DN20355_c0_g1_i1:122-1009(-)